MSRDRPDHFVFGYYDPFTREPVPVLEYREGNRLQGEQPAINYYQPTDKTADVVNALFPPPFASVLTWQLNAKFRGRALTQTIGYEMKEWIKQRLERWVCLHDWRPDDIWAEER